MNRIYDHQPKIQHAAEKTIQQFTWGTACVTAAKMRRKLNTEHKYNVVHQASDAGKDLKLIAKAIHRLSAAAFAPFDFLALLKQRILFGERNQFHHVVYMELFENAELMGRNGGKLKIQ
jgi:hypothetical protein